MKHGPPPQSQPWKPGRNFPCTRQLLLAAVAVAPAAMAQVTPEADPPVAPRNLQLEPQSERDPNRLGLSVRFGFNFSARFKNVVGFPPSRDPGPGPGAGSGFDHFYDDGYVRPNDVYPNNNGLTYFWGYQSRASQVTPTDMAFHSSSVATGVDGRVDPSGLPLGLELTYARELYRHSYGSWGVEIGAGWTDLNIRDTRNLSGQVFVVTDLYSRGNPPIEPPDAPFYGTFDGVNAPSIADAPHTRTVDPFGAVVTGQRKVASQVYTFRIGPYYDHRLSRWTSLQGGIGLAAAVVHSRFTFAETTTTELGDVRRTGRANDTTVLLGPYLAGQVMTTIADNVKLFGGVTFQMLGDASFTAGSKKVTLDFKEALFAHVGIGFSF